MFKRYADDNHWLFTIPLWGTRLQIWGASSDCFSTPGKYRRHLFVTWKREYVPCMSGYEIRVRIGLQYL